MAVRRRERSRDPLETLKNPILVSSFCAAWLFAALFLSSGTQGSAIGIGGADRFGVDVKGMMEEAVDPPADEALAYSAYAIRKGDNLVKVAEEFNVTLDTIVSFNNIKYARGLKIGQVIKIPNMSGIMYVAKAGDTVKSVAEKNKISADRIIEANGLFAESLSESEKIFLPNARLSSFTLREISGDLFKKPVQGWSTSYFGWRKDPFTGERRYHNGLDIGAGYGTPVGAAMEGTVAAVGYDPTLGNYISISHHDGYQTLYAHLSKTIVKAGQRVYLRQIIGNVGTSGYSTGAHLHFSVYKSGRPVDPLIVMN